MFFFFIFYFAISAVLTQRKKRLTWGDKGRASECVSPSPQIPAAGWVACQLPSELRSLSSARLSPISEYTSYSALLHPPGQDPPDTLEATHAQLPKHRSPAMSPRLGAERKDRGCGGSHDV